MVFKRFSAFVLSAVMLGCSLSVTGCADSGSEFDDGKMRKDMSSMDYADEMGIGINLGNTFEAYWEDKSNKTTGSSIIGDNTPQDYETCWGAVVITPEAVQGMADADFNTVRIPVYWGNMMEDNGKFKINEEYMARVREVVDYARKAQLYVVINIHHFDEFLIENKDKDTVLSAVDTLWTQIAKEFKGYSDYLVFEGFNEALGSQPEGANLSEEEIYDYVNDMNQTFVDAVRKTGGNNKKRVLIASGYWTNIDNTTKESFLMPQDSAEDKMMVSVHYIDNACYWTNNIGGDYWLTYSENQCKLLAEAFIIKDIPVFVGECTSIYDGERFAQNADVTDSSECLSTIMNMAVDYGFVPVLWDVSNNFYSRSDCKIKSDSDAQVILDIAERIENE
ncbi:MAG: glycoside hydrolase family 5 protein [Ruminococcus sp.]|nr:glycoside hydrolase family 5 protein [Ruminococcus sp.]